MERRDAFLLVLMLIATVAGIVTGCAWLITHLKPVAHLLLILFLAASG